MALFCQSRVGLLGVFVSFDGFDDLGFGSFSAIPAINFYPFACFQLFIVLEEVLDLGQQQLR